MARLEAVEIIAHSHGPRGAGELPGRSTRVGGARTRSAKVLGGLFLPTASPCLSGLLAVITYAAGFAARPVGAMLFGQLGDRIGPPATLIAMLLLTGLATSLVAAAPTYAERSSC